MATQSVIPMAVRPMEQSLTPERIKQIIDGLEVPFDPNAIEWRVTNTTKDKKRGAVIAYADQRAYTDRLNHLVTPAGWTRDYIITVSPHIERDGKQVAKVFIKCVLTIFGIGTHSSTGEGWTDDDNAGTVAEAQAFKRACMCFGLGRYLYSLPETWVDLDERKRPKSMPHLQGWATAQGWRQGLRPPSGEEQPAPPPPKPTQAERQQPRQQQRQQPVADNVGKETISAVVTEKRIEDRREQNLDSVLWLTVGSYKCASKDPKIWTALNHIKVGSKVTLLVSKFEGKEGPIHQIHKVIPNVPDMGGRQ